MKNRLVPFLFAGLTFACNPASAPAPDNTAAESQPGIRTFEIPGGGKLLVNESHPDGETISRIIISAEGISGAPVVLDGADPISDVLQGDLDANGTPEWYVITTGGGSGSYGKCYGVTLSTERSLVPIRMTEVQLPAAYQGHDQYSLEGNVLVRKFPLYQAGDPNAAPTGGDTSLRYQLAGQPDGLPALVPAI